jgi:crotonobetainyl-CoA:carnitine CoA-transferase CaiB-like acyl-CoA transferase
MQAFGGIMSTTGEPGRPSVRVGASIVDMGTGMWSVIGILTALHERHTTGRGRVVDVSLFETASCWVSLLAAQFLASGQLAGKQGSGAPGIVPYRGYVTRDGEIVVAAGSDGLFRSLAGALDRPEWLTDVRFTDNPSRVVHQVELYAMLDAIMVQQTTAHWIERLEAVGVPCSPVNDLAQMLAHPQTSALGLVQSVPGTGMQFVGLPLSFDGQRAQPVSAPPRLGEHNALLGFPAFISDPLAVRSDA